MSSRLQLEEELYIVTVPLASGAEVFQGDEIGVIAGTNTCDQISAVTAMLPLGNAVEDATYAVDGSVQVDLANPVKVQFFANDTGDGAITATDFLSKCYFKDQGTVTKSANNGSGLDYAVAGIVYLVRTDDGVGVARVSSEVSSLLS